MINVLSISKIIFIICGMKAESEETTNQTLFLRNQDSFASENYDVSFDGEYFDAESQDSSQEGDHSSNSSSDVNITLRQKPSFSHLLGFYWFLPYTDFATGFLETVVQPYDYEDLQAEINAIPDQTKCIP